MKIITFEDFEKSLNLNKINFLVSQKEEGPNWSKDKTERIEKYYKQFLFLCYLYPNKMLVPTKDVDEYWHNHIMDTQKYYDDCNSIFGKIFHHYPYLGTKGKKDKELLHILFQETLKLYVDTFGINPTSNSSSADCGGGCSGTACNGKNKLAVRKNAVYG